MQLETTKHTSHLNLKNTQPNEIPTEDHKSIDHQKHQLSKTTSTTTEIIEPLLIAPTLPPAEGDEVTIAETTEASFTSTTVSEPLTLLAPPELVVSGEVPAIESIGQTAALTASLPISEDIVTAEPVLDPSPESVEKTDVHNEAAKLLLAGVQLTSHDEEQAFLTNQLLESSIPSSIPSTTTTTTTTTTSTAASPTMLTSTETVTEISSFQERIKGYRRNRPAAMLKRANIRPLPVVRAPSTTTTTQRSTAPTKSYLERLAASRLRLSRLSQATKSTTKTTTTSPFAITTPGTTTTVSSLSQVRGGAEPGPNKKLSVRDIDRETKVVSSPAGKPSWESVHNNLQRFQVQRGNRVYTPATRSTASLVSTTPSPTTPRSYNVVPSSRSTATVNRGKNRYSNFKTQPTVQRTRGTTTPRSIITSTFSPSTASSLASLNQHISALASNYNNGFTYNQTPQISKPIQQSHDFATHTTGGLVAPAQPQTHTQSQTTSNISPSSAFLSFDKLTRAIVDESVLQNFKTAQSQQQQHRQQQHATRQVVKQQQPAVSSSTYVKPATAPGER